MPSTIQNPSELIMSLSDAIKWRNKLKINGKKLVVTNGCFDILHRGHSEYLMNARNHGDAFLILLNSDKSVQDLKGPTRPIVDEYSRAYMLASLKCVDSIVLFSTPQCTDLFSSIKPDIYIKGGDYTIDTINKEEKEALLAVNADIQFLPFIKGFSTSNIVEKIKNS